MTTIISFATRDCLVLGCDSLATSIKQMIDPNEIFHHYFDSNDKNLTLKKDKNGNTILKSFIDFFDFFEQVPYNQLPSVTKIFEIKPANAGFLFAGAAVIGNKSIKNIVDAFLSEYDISKYLKSTYTVYGIAKRFQEYLSKIYDESYGKSPVKPTIDILISGYSKNHSEPEIYSLKYSINDQVKLKAEAKRKEHKIVYGGQYDVIQRVVNGLDFNNYLNYLKKINEILNEYYKIIEEQIKNIENINIEPPNDDLLKQIKAIKPDWIDGISADMSDFSEQAAIDFVDFLVEIMIKSQQFSNRLPTVGGNIHIALLRKSEGFRWISKEEFNYKGSGIKKYERK